MRQITEAAQAARMIRNELKGLNIKASVTSKSYSMGNNINVDLFDVSDKQFKEIKELLSKYQYGEFDGMTDSYNASNRNQNIPQTKFLFINKS